MSILPKACRNPCASGAAAALRVWNPGAGPEISGSSPEPTGSECRFGIGASQAVQSSGEEISTSYRRGAKIGVAKSTIFRRPCLRCGEELSDCNDRGL
ncbi:hypothetical protein Taro_047970 [Colocasia esculenta]|uniref:Uncharacterized protein n=1 Tax=Colocasia esculenta TaxID=4460 RepID=A0A843X739_COLES|nr:hypothetical protein [Colocasia esculenta]